VSTLASNAEKENITILFLSSIFITITITSIFVIFSFKQLIIGRIQNLCLGIEKISAGNYKARINNNINTDEIGQIQSGFNLMAETIYERTYNLESLVNKRTKELTNSIQNLQQFAYSISHDFKAPVRSISEFSRILMEDFDHGLDEEGTDFLSRINRSALKLQNLIEDMLILSRISYEKTDYDYFEIDHILDAVLLDYEDEIKSANINVKRIGGNFQIYTNDVIIEQIVHNLIENAIKFRSKTDPNIKIHYLDEKEQYIIKVEDNGIGIPSEEFDKIFQKFYQLEAYFTGQVQGIGLGLAVAKKIVDEHKGSIWVESALGKGSKFIVLLPISH